MIDFYYWGYQCPYNYSNKKILEEVRDEHGIDVNFYELSENHSIAEAMNLYSPTMTIFNNGLRWSGPITHQLIKKYLSGEVLTRTPYIVKSENNEIVGELKQLTQETIEDINNLCCSRNCSRSSLFKEEWLQVIMDKYDLKNMGILHYLDGELVGGVEYVPSLEVPYKIPKAEDIAYITCVYASHPVNDYKSYPLKELEKHLVENGFNKVYAVASEKVVFPNGPLKWFIDKGYVDLGILYYEENDGAYQHLVEKVLRRNDDN